MPAILVTSTGFEIENSLSRIPSELRFTYFWLNFRVLGPIPDPIVFSLKIIFKVISLRTNIRRNIINSSRRFCIILL